MELHIFTGDPRPCIYDDKLTGSRLLVRIPDGTVLSLPCCPHCYLAADLSHEHVDVARLGAYKGQENGGIPE